MNGARQGRPAHKVLVVGLPGAGRTTVGSALAGQAGWPYLDDAALLERAVGVPPAELLATSGEAVLRAAESQVLTLLLGLPAPLVAALPGGVVHCKGDRTRLRANAHVVWLRARPETLAARAAARRPRRSPGQDPLTVLRALAATDGPLFAQVATQVVDVDVLTPAQVVRAVLDALPG